jgi:hypothetical protein
MKKKLTKKVEFMPKRITFQANKESTINTIDDYCMAKNTSRSATISWLLDCTVSLLGTITNHHYAAIELETALMQITKEQPRRSEAKLTLEEHFLTIWNEAIIYPKEILNLDFHNHKTSSGKMGKTEREEIKGMLEGLIEKFQMKKALYIYTDRRIDNSYLKAGGLSNTILLKKTTFDGYLFDVSNTVVLPIIQLIIFGIEETLRKNSVYLTTPSCCWVPVYHTNNLAVMVPVLREEDAPQSSKMGGNIVIVNPFANDVKI